MWRCERDQLSSLCLQTPSLCGYQPSRCVTENAKSPASILTELCLWKQVHGVLKARRLKWFAIPFSSGPLFVRTLHHDPSILGGPIGLAHSFIVLDKAVVHVIILVSFLWLWFLVWLPSDKDKRLMEASWWERLTEGETEPCSDGQGHVQ